MMKARSSRLWTIAALGLVLLSAPRAGARQAAFRWGPEGTPEGVAVVYYRGGAMTMNSVEIDTAFGPLESGAASVRLDFSVGENSYLMLDFATLIAESQADILVTAPILDVIGVPALGLRLESVGTFVYEVDPEVPGNVHATVELDGQAFLPDGEASPVELPSVDVSLTLCTDLQTEQLAPDGTVLDLSVDFFGGGNVSFCPDSNHPIRRRGARYSAMDCDAQTLSAPAGECESDITGYGDGDDDPGERGRCGLQLTLDEDLVRPGEPLSATLKVSHRGDPLRGVEPYYWVEDSLGHTVVDGWLPAASFDPGQQTVLQRQLVLPDDLEPGSYRLLAEVPDMVQGRVVSSRSFRVEAP